jgi:hypothetical protein
MSFANEKYGEVPPSYKDGGTVENFEGTRRRTSNFNTEKLSAAFENPLANIPKQQLLSDVETFCKQYNLNRQPKRKTFKNCLLRTKSRLRESTLIAGHNPGNCIG